MEYFNSLYNNIDQQRFFTKTKIITSNNFKETLMKLTDIKKSLIISDKLFENHEFIINNKFAKVYFVNNEPSINDIKKIISNLNSTKIFFEAIITFGGGSTHDAGKAIKAFYGNDGFNFNDQSKPLDVPLIAIPTINGSGSEASRFFVLFNETNSKKSYRNWDIMPCVCLIDLKLIKTAPPNLLLNGLFDSFIHIYETLICKYESSFITRDLSILNLKKIIKILSDIQKINDIKKHTLEIAIISVFGGISISNVRTGLIHTLGENLAKQIKISHPLSLAIFFKECMKFNMKFNILTKNFQKNAIKEWDRVLKLNNSMGFVKEFIKDSRIDKEQLLHDVNSDTVLFKENPAPLNLRSLKKIINDSLELI